MELMTYEQVENLMGISARQRRRLQRRWVVRPTGERLANGRPEQGILLSSLPAAAQRRWRGEDEPQQALVPRADQEPEAASGADEAPLPGLIGPVRDIPRIASGWPNLAWLRVQGFGEEADKFEQRIEAVVEVRQARGLPHGKTGPAMDRLARRYGVSRSTLYAWENAERRGHYMGLLDTSRLRQRGQTRAIPPELQRDILDLWSYQGRYTVAQIMRQSVQPWCRDRDVVPPSRSTVRRFLKERVLPQIRVIARDGVRAWETRHAPRVYRRVSDLQPGLVWSSDHRRGDNFAVVPDGKGAGWPSATQNSPCPCGTPFRRRECCSLRRPWWSATVDIGSGAIVGLRVSLQPNSAVVADMLEDALISWGPPDLWQRDNGREFTANRFSGATHDYGGGAEADTDVKGDEDAIGHGRLWAELGVEVTNCLPYASWSKYAETIFSAFSQFENTLPGWVGRDTAGRPEKLDGEIDRGDILTLEDYIRVLGEQIEEWNAAHTVGNRDAPPRELYARADRPSVDAAKVGYLLQKRGKYRVKGDTVKVDGVRYSNVELARWSGCRLPVRWRGRAAERVYVYPPDADPPCIAAGRQEAARYGVWTDANREAAGARKVQREMIRGFAAAVKGTASIEAKDPTGAHRRARKHRLEAEARRREEQAEPAQAARRQAAARQAAAQPEDNRPTGLYSREALEALRRKIGGLDSDDKASDAQAEARRQREAAGRPMRVSVRHEDLLPRMDALRSVAARWDGVGPDREGHWVFSAAELQEAQRLFQEDEFDTPLPTEVEDPAAEVRSEARRRAEAERDETGRWPNWWLFGPFLLGPLDPIGGIRWDNLEDQWEVAGEWARDEAAKGAEKSEFLARGLEARLRALALAGHPDYKVFGKGSEFSTSA